MQSPLGMYQVRFHGRGGQGVVTAAELLSVAAFLEGKYAQAFPTFGSERMGAPVVSFCRIDAHAIRVREPVTEPDAVVVQDPTLLRVVPVLDGCRPNAYVLVNSARQADELELSSGSTHLASVRWVCLPATEIARRHLGRALPNVPLLGALSGLTGVVGLDSVLAAIRDRFPGDIGERNVSAARAAFDAVSASEVSAHG